MTPDTLIEIYTRTARSGNTTAVVEFAKQHGAIVIVHDQREAQRVRALGVRTVSVQAGIHEFIGSTHGYIVDMPVLSRVAGAWAADRQRRMAAEQECDEQRARAEGAERALAAAVSLAHRLTDEINTTQQEREEQRDRAASAEARARAAEAYVTGLLSEIREMRDAP
jgi:chromosome segregation ATPase